MKKFEKVTQHEIDIINKRLKERIKVKNGEMLSDVKWLEDKYPGHIKNVDPIRYNPSNMLRELGVENASPLYWHLQGDRDEFKNKNDKYYKLIGAVL